MKNVKLFFGIALVSGLMFTSCQKADLPSHQSPRAEHVINKSSCTKIQSGTLLTSEGSVIQTGYDQWGYNYQARKFNGYYCDAYRDASWCQAYADVKLMMEWNDAWLSNEDCDGDGLLDRHHGYSSYIGSGAWITNHMSSSYVDANGNTCNWTNFVKIVAVPGDATLTEGVWYEADGTEIGPEIWSDFAIIQEVYNDPCAGYNGVQNLSPSNAGLGSW